MARSTVCGWMVAAALLLGGALSPPASADQRAYATDTSGALAMLDLGPGGAPTPITGSPLTGLGQIEAITITPDARHLYVARRSISGVLGFEIGADGGLTPLTNSPWAAAGEIYALALTPDGSRLYAAGRGPGVTDLYGFDVGTGGVLTPLTGSPFTVRANARGIAISADGSFLFEVVNATSQLAVYAIGAAGTLTEASGSPYTIGQNSFGVAVTPDGKSVYVASSNANATYAFSIGAGGALTAIPQSPFPAPGSTFDGEITPAGDGYYVASAAPMPNLLGGFSIAAGGTLAPVPGSPFPVPVDGRAVAISGAGDRVYVTNSSTNSLGAYTRAADGGLTQIGGSPFNIGLATPDFDSVALTPAQAPVAAFSFAAAGKSAGTVFDARGSSDADAEVARYDWDFGDGTVLADGGPQPEHSYAGGGPFTVSLTVTDSDGCSTASPYTGQMVSCNGSPTAKTTAVVGPAPSTKLTKKPRRKLTLKRGKKVKVKFAFKSSDPAAAFRCTIDRKTAPCSSPLKKKVKKGRRKFAVAATARGLTDPTPAKYRFKVKRKRR